MFRLSTAEMTSAVSRNAGEKDEDDENDCSPLTPDLKYSCLKPILTVHLVIVTSSIVKRIPANSFKL